MSKNVLIVGTGTIGEPLIGLFSRFREEFGLDNVLFHKRTPLKTDRSKVYSLQQSGSQLVVDRISVDSFRDLDIEPVMTYDEALRMSDVVIDCTPVGNENKDEIYKHFDNISGFIAQGSESGFGTPYARGINDEALKDEKFIQVVSCNTHALSSIVKTLAYGADTYGTNYDQGNLLDGKFLLTRRATDISQGKGFIPAPTVDTHSNKQFGTHHAYDAHRLFGTLGFDPNIFSSSLKTNSQYMHLMKFDLTVRDEVSKDQLIERIHDNEHLAVTYKNSAAEIFSFGRDHGGYGRILNHAVIPIECLNVRKTRGGYHIAGHSFTPQDGNSLISSTAAALRFLDRDGHSDQLHVLKPYFFDEV